VIQPSLVKRGSEDERMCLSLACRYFLYAQSATRLFGAEISTGKRRPQDTGIRNVLVTGKMSEQFPWLEPKSSDFALELFTGPGSSKAEETQCGHSDSKRSLRVCRTQVSAPGRSNSAVLQGEKCSPMCQCHVVMTAALMLLDPSSNVV